MRKLNIFHRWKPKYYHIQIRHGCDGKIPVSDLEIWDRSRVNFKSIERRADFSDHFIEHAKLDAIRSRQSEQSHRRWRIAFESPESRYRGMPTANIWHMRICPGCCGFLGFAPRNGPREKKISKLKTTRRNKDGSEIAYNGEKSELLIARVSLDRTKFDFHVGTGNRFRYLI